MRITIVSRAFNMQLSDVVLLDGCIPSVGDSNRGIPLGQLPKIEPAVWFKALILKDISIDCEQVDILLTYDVPSPSPDVAGTDVVEPPGCAGKGRRRRQQLTQSMYNNGEFHSEDLREICAAVQVCATDYKDHIIGIEALNNEILRVLHCCILPAINIKPYMLPIVETAYSNQEQSINTVNEQLEEQSGKAELLDQSRLRLFNRILKECREPGASMSPAFAKILHADVEKEIERTGRILRSKQERQEERKGLYESGELMPLAEMGDEEKLDENDKDREWHTFLLECDEQLQNIARGVKGGKIQAAVQKPRRQTNFDSPVYNIYAEMNRQREFMIKAYQELLDRKVMMLSVKEALRNTISILKRQNCTPGFDTDKLFATRSTDVLRRSVVTNDWLMLREKLARLLKDPNHRLSIRFQEFCQTVKAVCEASLEDGGQTSDENPKTSHRHDEDYSQHILNNIKRVLFDHFDRMSGDLAVALNCHSPKDNRLRIWYESHVYQETLPSLIQVYRKCHATDYDLLTEFLPKISLKDLDLGLTGTSVAVVDAERMDESFSDEEKEPDMPDTTDECGGGENLGQVPGLTDVTDGIILSSKYDASPSESDKDSSIERRVRSTKVVYIKPDLDKQNEQSQETSSRSNQDKYSIPDIPRLCSQVSESTENTHFTSDDSLPHKIQSGQLNITDLDRKVHLGVSEMHKTTDTNQNDNCPELQVETHDRRLSILPQYSPVFDTARGVIQKTINENILVLKLRKLKECLQILTQEVDQNTGRGSTADDVLDLVVVLLAHKEAAYTAELYIHVKLMENLIPTCMQCGLSGYSLNQFICSFQYVIERIHDMRRCSTLPT